MFGDFLGILLLLISNRIDVMPLHYVGGFNLLRFVLWLNRWFIWISIPGRFAKNVCSVVGEDSVLLIAIKWKFWGRKVGDEVVTTSGADLPRASLTCTLQLDPGLIRAELVSHASLLFPLCF